MNKYSIQLAALMVVCGINFCSAGEKKCPPEGVELKPVNLNSVEELTPLYGTWKQWKCNGSSYCDRVSCAEYTYAKGDKIYFHGSAYSESCHKPFATTGYSILEKPGVFQGYAENDVYDGTFYLLLLEEKIFIIAACLKDNEFGVYVARKKGKLEPNVEAKAEKILKYLKVPLTETPQNECGKKRSCS